MYKITITILAFLSVACEVGDQTPRETWGDGAEQIVHAYCERIIEHGSLNPDEWDYCIEAVHEERCEQWTCEAGLTDEDRDMLDACESDLYEWDCRGWLPGSCYAVLERGRSI